jgi:hypothetical protein
MENIVWSKNIGVDFDDVVAETFKATLKYHNYMFGWKALEYNQVTHFYLNQVLWFDHVSLQDCIDYFNQFLAKPEWHALLKPIIDSLETCAYLKSKWHSLQIITARPSFLNNNMIDRLDTNWVSSLFNDVMFLEHKWHGSDITKSSVCKDLNIHVMIEDAAHNAEKLAHDNITTFVPRRPWNRNLQDWEHIITVGNHHEDDARQEIKWIYQATH